MRPSRLPSAIAMVLDQSNSMTFDSGLGNNINKGQDAVKTPLTLYVQEDFTPAAIFPESFTHGTSAQRTGWFTRGLQTGSMADCDTLGAKKL